LALGPSTTTPADDVAAWLPDAVRPRPGSRGRAADDPALVDDLLSVPRTHLVVDGYNVTKTGYGELSLADQRDRLLSGLLRVAAAGTEVTVCFDGADGGPRPVHAPRGVRVLFSSGEIADDLIRRLVAAEPPGRPVVVVTSDRAVADDVQAMGAACVPAHALLARLARR
ncbi:MAG: NYN domain-containing protein, partial [Cellulosimicrobium funkei]